MELEVGDTVAVHKNVAFLGGEHFGKGQPQLLPFRTLGNAGCVDALFVKVIHHKLSELVIGDLANESRL